MALQPPVGGPQREPVARRHPDRPGAIFMQRSHLVARQAVGDTQQPGHPTPAPLVQAGVGPQRSAAVARFDNGATGDHPEAVRAADAVDALAAQPIRAAGIGADPQTAVAAFGKRQNGATVQAVATREMPHAFAAHAIEPVRRAHPDVAAMVLQHGAGEFLADAAPRPPGEDRAVAQAIDAAIGADPEIALAVLEKIAHKVVAEAVGGIVGFEDIVVHALQAHPSPDLVGLMALTRSCGKPLAVVNSVVRLSAILASPPPAVPIHSAPVASSASTDTTPRGKPPAGFIVLNTPREYCTRPPSRRPR